MFRSISVKSVLALLIVAIFAPTITTASAQQFTSASDSARAYYFLRNLASGVPTSGYNASPYLPEGMAGIGIDRAQKIWARTSSILKGSTNDLTALTAATLQAASELYGETSTEHDAVKKSWRALNVAATAITIITPAGGEDWRVATNHTIRWNYSGSPGSYVRIKYRYTLIPSSSLWFWGTVTNKTAIGTNGSGSYVWAMPCDIGGEAQIYVESTANSAYSDYSNSFNVLGPSQTITVTSPAVVGDVWLRGTNHTIKWTYTGNIGSTVKIAAVALTGQTYIITNSASASTGSFNWTVPSTYSPMPYLIGVTSNTWSCIPNTSSWVTIQ